MEQFGADHLLRLTRQLITDQVSLPDTTPWDLVIASLGTIAVEALTTQTNYNNNSNLTSNTSKSEAGGAFDLRNQLKIKKVPGSVPESSEFVDGLVFSKRVAHKSMLETIENPRILTIAFPLEYQRSSQHFQYVSLETVLAQEKDYLHLLMGRIISLRPAVVLVGGNVSRIALDFFVRARVSLCTNVKPEILEAVARCSGSTIVKSFDQLIESSVGLFGRYSVRVFDDPLIEGTRKSFVYLEGCPKERIGTIILRGATFSDLVTIKSVMSIVAFASYNIHVERAFLQDELAFLMVEESEDLKTVASATCDDGTSRLQLALKKYESTCLSVSPYVTYPVPYILAKLNQLKNIPLDTVSMASSTVVQDQLISSLESNSAPYYEKLDSLSPFNYQKIVFLFSSICIDTMIPCQPAELHVIEYYSETDISVGAYIKELCTNNHSTCPTKGCGLPMIRHFRSYAHGEGRLSVTVEQLDISTQDGIQMWTYCKNCKSRTPTILLSQTSCNYSFGKYLELIFYMAKTGNAELPECSHDIHREHIRFFAYKKFIVRFEFEPLDLLEVSVPSMKMQISHDVCLRLKTQDYESRRSQIIKFYDSVVSRIKHFSNEVLPQDKVLLFKDFSNGLSKRAVSEKKTALQLLQQSFTSSSDTDSLALNTVLHSLYENVGKWENDFSVLARSFFTVDLTKENLSRRMIVGSIHLRDIFSDHTAVPPLLPTHHLKEVEMRIELGSSPVKQFDDFLEELEAIQTAATTTTTTTTGINQSFMIRQHQDADDLDLSKLVAASLDDENSSQENNHDDANPIFMESASSLIGVNSDFEPLPIVSTPPVFSMAARWRLESMEAEEEEESGNGSGDRRSNNIVSISSSNNELEETVDLPAAVVFSNPVPIASGERASILKTISTLWTGSVASLPPLEYPLMPSDHLFHDSLVIVREDEPSSIIAFTLSSSKYINKLKQWQLHPSSESLADNGQDELAAPSEAPAMSNGTGDIEEKLTSGKGHHIKFEFWDGNTKLDCKVFYAEQFDALRRNCGFEDSFVHTLSRCVKWDALGGKSGAAFLKTRDDRLILKQLSRQEMEALLKFAPYYFTYISEAFFHKLPTVLAKLFGFYRIAFKNPTTNKSLKMDVLVMENLFFERKVSRIFDLKGSMRNRHVQSTGHQNQVLLDENLLEYLCESPIFIREYSKRILRASVWNDTLFLAKMDVMDYSLLVGIDEEKKELVVGIVDYMRTFTWDKKLESWVKETGILGGGTIQPTILSPRQYKNRFRESMDRYFLTVTSFLETVE